MVIELDLARLESYGDGLCIRGAQTLSSPAVIIVTTSYPIAKDGSEAAGSFVSDFAEELAKHVPVRVVAPGFSSANEQWGPSLEVFRYAAPPRPLSTLKLWHPADMVEIVRVLRAGARATRAAVKAGPTAHILALWALPSGEWARRVAREQNVAYSVWVLGSDVWSLGRIPGLRWMLARVMREAIHSYADGYKLAEDARRIAGVPIGFLPSTREVSLTNASASLREEVPYRLLFLGRWHSNKGVDLLLDALGLLRDDDWARIESVDIQGGGPLESLVCARISALRADGRPVEMGGFLAKHEAEAAIARADWVLIPSRIESIPVMFSDAMKLGRPVIASPVGDLPKLLADPVCGVLAKGVSAEMFCHAIQRALMASPCSFAMAVRSQAAQFDLSRIAKDFSCKVAGNG